MRIFLLHGMGRSIASMAYLAWRLRQAGHETELFGYLVSVRDLGEITERFVERVREVLEQDAQSRRADDGSSDGTYSAEQPVPYAVIGHSLGNVITRLACPQLPPGFCRFVLLAPPNHSPTLASQLEGNKLFHFFTGDAGKKLADPEFYEQLPVPPVPALIVAGTGGPRGARLPLGDVPNDGILKREETRLGDIPMIEVAAIHTFLMNRTDVFELIRDFLAGADADAEAPPSTP